MSLEFDGEAKRVAKYRVWQLNKCLKRRRAGLVFWVLGAALLAPAPIRGQVNGILNKLRQLSQTPRQPIHKSNSLLPQQSAQQAVHNVPGGPHIASVSPIYPLRTQKIVIRGTGFGTADPYNGWSGYLMFVDISHGNGITSYWQAGCPVYVCGTGGVSIYVTKWTPTEIDVEGFPQNYGTGTFGMCNCTFQTGHQVQILVANPQMLGAIKQPAPAPYSFPAAAHGTPYDAYTATVAPWQNPVSITSVSTLQARRLQKIVIRGTGFGNHEPFNGTTPFLGFKDITANNWEAGFDGTVGIIVSSWTPNEITINGFSQGYGGDRVLHNGDMVSISVGDPQMTGVVNNPGTEFHGAPHATKFVTVGEPSPSTTNGSPTVQVRTPVVNGMSVSVNGVATPSAPGVTIMQIAWNWGDGTPTQVGWFPEIHTYAQAGNYTVTVTATDSNGLTGSGQTTAQLSPILPGGGFIPKITSVGWEPSVSSNWTMTILGTHLGSGSTGLGTSEWLKITDTHKTGGSWQGGYTGDWVSVDITKWDDGEILIDHFGGRYGLHLYLGLNWTFEPGDQVQVEVWNPETRLPAVPFDTTFPPILSEAQASEIHINYSCQSVPLSGVSSELGQMTKQFGNDILLHEGISLAIDALLKIPEPASSLMKGVAGTYTVGTEINGIISDYQTRAMINSFLQGGWCSNQQFNVCMMNSNSSLSVTNAPYGWTNPVFLIYPLEAPKCASASSHAPQPTVSTGSASIRLATSPATVVEGGQFRVSGELTNANGATVAGISVQLSALVSGSTLPLTTVTTDQNGSFTTILNAPPVTGSVVITATVQDTLPPVQGTATLTVTGSP